MPVGLRWPTYTASGGRMKAVSCGQRQVPNPSWASFDKVTINHRSQLSWEVREQWTWNPLKIFIVMLYTWFDRFWTKRWFGHALKIVWFVLLRLTIWHSRCMVPSTSFGASMCLPISTLKTIFLKILRVWMWVCSHVCAHLCDYKQETWTKHSIIFLQRTGLFIRRAASMFLIQPFLSGQVSAAVYAASHSRMSHMSERNHCLLIYT